MTVTTAMIKELREATGAAILDCKKALESHDGDMEQAKAFLMEKGLAKAKKRTEKAALEGLIETYTHPGGRVGVMVEVNCETDFVANTDKFKEFVHAIVLHIAFSDPAYVDTNAIPKEVLEAKKSEFFTEAKESGKPDNIVEKIVEGRLNKYFAEACLLHQPFVKDDSMTISEMLDQARSELQENVLISRFARFELGQARDDGDGEDEE